MHIGHSRDSAHGGSDLIQRYALRHALGQNAHRLTQQADRTVGHDEPDDHADDGVYLGAAGDHDDHRCHQHADRAQSVSEDMQEGPVHIDVLMVVAVQHQGRGHVRGQADQGDDEHGRGHDLRRGGEALPGLAEDA